MQYSKRTVSLKSLYLQFTFKEIIFPTLNNTISLLPRVAIFSAPLALFLYTLSSIAI